MLVLVVLVIVLLVVYLIAFVTPTPPSPDKVRLNMTIDYFAKNYNATIGLIAETPGSHTFWLYSDNYLAVLAISRYEATNSSTSGFALALRTALDGYVATLPPSLVQSQYTVLNSTVGSFHCSANYSVAWTKGGQLVLGGGSASLMTTANNQSPSCASQNYADIMLLRAVYYNRVGNSTGASYYYGLADKDFDGLGFADLAYANSSLSSYHNYQTYKLALFIYATYCLGEQGSSSDLAKATETLRFLQSNSTGGFAAEYTPNLTSLNAPPATPGQAVNTETTALAALALEQVLAPSSSC